MVRRTQAVRIMFPVWPVHVRVQVSLSVLRTNRDMLVSVLESFIHDPLVEWSGREARPTTSHRGGIAATLEGAEKENRDGLNMIKRLSDRLDGHYNVGVTALVCRPTWWSSRANTSTANVRRFGVSPLSISGQVHRLIREATSDENLALMYFGWMPFL